MDEISDKAGSAVAGNVLDHLVTVIDKLAIVPRASGRLVPALGTQIRCHVVGSYNVYLRYDEVADVLIVVRVLHGRRNITAALFRT